MVYSSGVQQVGINDRMATKKKKPPTPSLEQEAKAFISTKKTPEDVPTEAPPSMEQLAASVLAGLIASGAKPRPQELVEEAYRYVDLILRYKK